MGRQPSKQLLLQLVVFAILYVAATQPVPNPNCTRSCGSLSNIPFPFGATEECSLDPSFLIDCNNSSPFLHQSNLTVLTISLHGQLRISLPVATACQDDNGTDTDGSYRAIDLPHFSMSPSRNMLTAIGCDNAGLVLGGRTDSASGVNKTYATGCVSWCDRLQDINAVNGSCTGTGCCQIPIPAHEFTTIFYRALLALPEEVDPVDIGFNPCGHAFVAEVGAYDFVTTDIVKFERTQFPVVLDWTVGNLTCQQASENASSYACKAEHSECFDSTKELGGYLCNCSAGFRGNPYLLYGCQDVNECKESNDCCSGARCHNFPGGYYCSCSAGYKGDGRKGGTKCSPRFSFRVVIILLIALSVNLCFLALLVISFSAYWGSKKRRLIKLREHFFQQNGGLLLQQHIARHNDSTATTIVFTMEELKTATDDFDAGKILGQGGLGTVYKGLLPDNRIVAIKKSKISDPSQIEHFINELVVLSQINHRNVVKLLGCCLETEVPLLVYEFIPNGTVSEHLHGHSQYLRLTWETRLRIAAETAGALAYLHSAASTPIIHRDVKTTNILLDHNLTAKVSDFGASRIVPLDQTQLTTLVQGTLGYLDPEYFLTSHLTDKSDVYSFGVVLAELLTGRKALSFAMPDVDRNLAQYFVSSIKEGCLLEIVDRSIIDEAKVEQLLEFANIAKQCLRLKREERPTMKEVAAKLEELLVEEKHEWESDTSH